MNHFDLEFYTHVTTNNLHLLTMINVYLRYRAGGLGEVVAAPGDGVPVGNTTIGVTGATGVIGALVGVASLDSVFIIADTVTWSSAM